MPKERTASGELALTARTVYIYPAGDKLRMQLTISCLIGDANTGTGYCPITGFERTNVCVLDEDPQSRYENESN
jgi:hypothetical protein